jgi:hypothetical protein
MLATGTPAPRPMAAAMARKGMPSSATACTTLAILLAQPKRRAFARLSSESSSYTGLTVNG